MTSIDHAIVSPFLIGRDREAAMLARELDASLAGHGRILALGGEAGIGKSRLLAVLAQEAADRGAIVLRGRCFEHEQSTAFAPLRDMLQAWVADAPADLAEPEMTAITADLAGIAPELARYVTGAGTPARQDRAYYFHLLVRWLLALADRRPIVVQIEDVHWTDDASLAFVAHLAHHVATAPFMLVVSYRNDEIGPNLTQTLTALRRGD